MDKDIKIVDWYGLYGDSWQKEVDPAAFSHPAKFARGLIRAIYKHALAQGYLAPGDTVLDCFGGVGLGALDAIKNGINWFGVELESEANGGSPFVELGQKNIARWNQLYRPYFEQKGKPFGSARLVQGDSRNLVAILEAAGACVGSPPYATGAKHTGGKDPRPEHIQGGELRYVDYGQTNGQLAAMAEGSLDAALGSPPYSNRNVAPTSIQGSEAGSLRQNEADGETYGRLPGQLSSMPEGGFNAAIVSPPYADAVNGNGEGPGARHDPVYHNGDNAFKKSSQDSYGQTAGNLGNLNGAGFDAALASPPWESTLSREVVDAEARRNWARANGISNAEYVSAIDMERVGARDQKYGDTPGNMGNSQGETFWSAARQIVGQVYQVLRPGGYTIWTTGDFVREKKRVYFGQQWWQLCQVVGLEPVEWIRAWKTSEPVLALDLFGNTHTQQTDYVSFFRRLANENNPDAAILNEDVLILRKPL